MGCCRWFCSSIFVAVVAYIAYYAKYIACVPDWRICTPTAYWQARIPPDIQALDVSDTAMLKRVLFSGEPWLLQCYSGLPYAGQHLPAPYRLDDVFIESTASMKSFLRAGTLDCEAKMPSNKTLISKFGLTRRTQPLLLYAGGGDRPKQVPSASATSVYGVTAWVKPKAEAKVKVARSQKAILAYCASRRACLLSRLEPDSVVLDQLARKFRTIEIVSIGDTETTGLSWGRGEEVGETLEEEEAKHFGQRNSFLRADPEAPRQRKGARPAPRLLRGFTGEEDLPSLTKFLDFAVDADPEVGGFVRSELPTLTPLKQQKKKEKKQKREPTANDNAERQAKRAKMRAEKAKKEAEKAEAQNSMSEEEKAAKLNEQRRSSERKRREQMAAEEANAANIVEEAEDFEDVDEGDETDGYEEDIEVDDFDEEVDDGSDVLDLDA